MIIKKYWINIRVIKDRELILDVFHCRLNRINPHIIIIRKIKETDYLINTNRISKRFILHKHENHDQPQH
jgi:hypothetical protein